MKEKQQMAESAEMWQRSSYCADQHCVEVALLPDGRVGVRDSKDPGQQNLVIDLVTWGHFLDGIAAGEFRDI